MDNQVTVFRTEVKSDGYTHVRHVEVDKVTGSVQFTSYSRGPRGGYSGSSMGAGFTADEFAIIMHRVQAVLDDPTMADDHFKFLVAR
jgi:hypothetical protein